MRNWFTNIGFLILALISLINFNASAAEVEPLEECKIFNKLETALEYFDELPGLADTKWLGRDKKSANQDLDNTINDVIELLDAPQISSHRKNYRKLELSIADELNEIARLQEARLFAPSGESSFLTNNVPFSTVKEWTAKTRGDYDILIGLRENNIAGYRESMSTILMDMQELLYAMGVELEADQIEVWLSSVVGDDVITMSIVFNSIRQITQQLEVVTNDSGENLKFARRYYGMVVILHKLMLTMQSEFIKTIDTTHLPKLTSFKKEASTVIAESEKLLRSGGNRETLGSNIKSNQMTIKAIDLYSSILKEQRAKVFEAMQISQREYAVAVNTYKTVNLSSEVAQLIKQGRNTFQTLINLQIPDARPFQNEEMKEQFRRLSQRMDMSAG